MVAGSIWLGSGPAGAVDWQVLYRLSESLRVSDNIQNSDDRRQGGGVGGGDGQQGGASAGIGFSSSTNAALDVMARTPTETWLTTGNIGHTIFFGEGVPAQRERTTLSARSNLLKTTLDTDYNLSAHYSMVPATRSFLRDPRDPDLTDPDVTDPDLLDPDLVDPEFPGPIFADIPLALLEFDRINYGARGGLVHRRTRADVLSLSARATRSDFSGDAADTAVPLTVLEVSGGWTRLMTRRVDGRARASVRYVQSGDEDGAQRMIYSGTVGTNFRATRRLTMDANVGVSVTDLHQSGDGTTGGPPQSDGSVSFTGDIRLSYTPWRDTSVAVSFSQRVLTDSLGEVSTRQAVRGTAAYRINDLSSINVLGTFINSDAASGQTQAWSVSPSYQHALSQYWDLSLSYRFVKTDTAQSNAALLTLSHRGTLLP